MKVRIEESELVSLRSRLKLEEEGRMEIREELKDERIQHRKSLEDMLDLLGLREEYPDETENFSTWYGRDRQAHYGAYRFQTDLQIAAGAKRASGALSIIHEAVRKMADGAS